MANSADSIEANATPTLPAPPVIGNFFIAGTNFSLAGIGGVANAAYYVLYSTNLALPSSSWPRLRTNLFDNSGNFSFTNALNSNFYQIFYRLLLP